MLKYKKQTICNIFNFKYMMLGLIGVKIEKYMFTNS